MGRPIKLIGYLCFLMALCSCKETKEQQISRLIHEWEGRTIVYPADMTFSVLGKDSAGYSFPQNEYTIMTTWIRWAVPVVNCNFLHGNV